MVLDNYDDYHDDGTYNVPATHTVTRATINADYGLFTSFLIPTLATTRDITYVPINEANFSGGSIEMDTEKALLLVGETTDIQTYDFFGTTLGFDCSILHIAKNGDIPRNIQLTSGMIFNYGSTPLINSDTRVILALNIGATSANGYVSEACMIEFFTGNEPTNVTGGTLIGFDEGVSTITFDESTHFTLDVVWSLDYAIDPGYVPEDHNISVYPNPFNDTNEISFTLSKPQNVRIEVFNLKGQKIAALTDENYTIGSHSVTWNGKDSTEKNVANGTYFYKIHFEQCQPVLRKVNILR